MNPNEQHGKQPDEVVVRNVESCLLLPPDWDPAEPALLGLSGGPDSLALLAALCRTGWKQMIACHLDHALRPESRNETKRVAAMAAQFDCRFESRRSLVATRAKAEKLSLEAAGRQCRHRFFAAMLRKHRAQGVFLAHHADDQAETVLLNLLRGAGSSGLGAMQPVETLSTPAITLSRPFLRLPKAALSAYAGVLGLDPLDDPSNDDRTFTRNRLRHELLPFLSEVMQRDVRPALCRAAEILRAEDAFLDGIAQEAFQKLFHAPALDIASTAALPTALRRRVLLHFFLHHDVPGAGFFEVESADAMLRRVGPRRINLPGGHHLVRKREQLVIEFPAAVI
jgi:tRNA(Ile)-lysidine synthase